MIAAGKAVPIIQLEHGLAVVRVYTGSFMTSLDMAGLLTLMICRNGRMGRSDGFGNGWFFVRVKIVGLDQPETHFVQSIIFW